MSTRVLGGQMTEEWGSLTRLSTALGQLGNWWALPTGLKKQLFDQGERMAFPAKASP